MSQNNVQKSLAYDNAAYIARGSYTTITTAGSGGVSGKFVAHANLLLFSANFYTTVAATSTYTTTGSSQYYVGPSYILSGTSGTATTTTTVTSTLLGSATVHINASQYSLIRIINTASFGSAPSLTTSTYGPYFADTWYTNGTATGGVGSYNQVALNTTTGTAGLNGLAINQGDQVYFVNGTDTAAVNLITIDYQVQPLANVLA